MFKKSFKNLHGTKCQGPLDHITKILLLKFDLYSSKFTSISWILAVRSPLLKVITLGHLLTMQTLRFVATVSVFMSLTSHPFRLSKHEQRCVIDESVA